MMRYMKGNAMRVAKLLLATMTIGALNPTFAGDKVVLSVSSSSDSISKLRKLVQLKKDEFEKTGDFSKRLCAQTYKELGVVEKAPIIVGLEQGEYATSARYNADKQAFVIRIGGGSLYYDAGEDYNDEFRWNTSFDPLKFRGVGIAKEYSENSGIYTGKNAFGVSKEIKVGAKTSAVLYFPSQGYNSLEITYPSKPEEARRIQNDLRVAVVTLIQPPCFVSGKGRKPPTISYLYDLALTEVGIVGNRNPEWILYLDSTKEVLKRGKFR